MGPHSGPGRRCGTCWGPGAKGGGLRVAAPTSCPEKGLEASQPSPSPGAPPPPQLPTLEPPSPLAWLLGLLWISL